MSMLTDFFTLAGGVVSSRAYPNVAPAEPVTPYLTYFRVSAAEDNTVDSNGGAGNLVNTRLQVDVWGSTYAQAQTSADALKAALKGWLWQNLVINEQDLYEPDTKLHRALIELSIWHT